MATVPDLRMALQALHVNQRWPVSPSAAHAGRKSTAHSPKIGVIERFVRRAQGTPDRLTWATKPAVVYERTVRCLIAECVQNQRRSGLVLAMGPSQSGKSTTMFGDLERFNGIIDEALVDLFGRENGLEIALSCCVVSNEGVHNLLDLDHSRILLQTLPIPGAPISSIVHAREVLSRARHRQQSDYPNFGHLLVTVSFREGQFVTFADLGSGANSLTSIMNLRRCLEAIQWNDQHVQRSGKIIPYRNCALTRVLAASHFAGSADNRIVVIEHQINRGDRRKRRQSCPVDVVSEQSVPTVDATKAKTGVLAATSRLRTLHFVQHIDNVQNIQEQRQLTQLKAEVALWKWIALSKQQVPQVVERLEVPSLVASRTQYEIDTSTISTQFEETSSSRKEVCLRSSSTQTDVEVDTSSFQTGLSSPDPLPQHMIPTATTSSSTQSESLHILLAPARQWEFHHARISVTSSSDADSDTTPVKLPLDPQGDLRTVEQSGSETSAVASTEIFDTETQLVQVLRSPNFTALANNCKLDLDMFQWNTSDHSSPIAPMESLSTQVHIYADSIHGVPLMQSSSPGPEHLSSLRVLPAIEMDELSNQLPCVNGWCPLTPPAWVPDDAVDSCRSCHEQFWFLRRRHHCRCCGCVYCYSCCSSWRVLPWDPELQRVCVLCVNMRSNF